MSVKPKFQISRLLDERIKCFVGGTGGEPCDSEFAHVSSAYILGFNNGNVTNYVGLTTNFQLHHAIFPVVGLAFFKSTPGDDHIKSSLESSPNGLDRNENLFLIYTVDEESKQLVKRIFDLSSGGFAQEQPKLSVLDEAKIFNHSAITRLSISLRLDICDKSGKLLTKNKIDTVLNTVKDSFLNDTKNISIHLSKSSFSTNLASKDKNSVETLYDYLDPPSEIDEMGDYLPQMSKKDKAILVEKWRNKVKSQREPLELSLEHEGLVFDQSGPSLPESYRLPLEIFLHSHVNEPISKFLRMISVSLRHRLDMLQVILGERAGTAIELDELKPSTFKPSLLGHFVPAFYAIPSNSSPDYRRLAEFRREMHLAYLIPLDQPQFRYSQRITNVTLTNADEQAGYLCNVHKSILDRSGIKGGSHNVINGTYCYHHYMQERSNDNGWGCAYRSLQTIISWFKHQGYIYSPDVELRAPKSSDKSANDMMNSLRKKLSQESRVPTHEEIQSVLVDVGDKQPSFIGSQKWIGSQEVCYVLNHLYNLESKFLSVSSGGELVYKARELAAHFATQSTPVMIGGGVLAHTIIGVDFNEKNGDISYLILDPHYTGAEDLAVITKKGWCGWKKNSFWDKSAFYNLCLPQRHSEF